MKITIKFASKPQTTAIYEGPIPSDGQFIRIQCPDNPEKRRRFMVEEVTHNVVDGVMIEAEVRVV